MKCIVVSHTHWDREWYRTFEQFRARLVDTVDSVLDLIETDPGYHFLLDGQTVILEDYLEVRPNRRDAIEQACRDNRLAIGPWYVQPDSLLPSGEAHVRNLLEGRRVGREFGPVSRVAYTPDSFGHPAQFPQIFARLGLGPFVYWRGNGDEIDELPAEYRWEAPDGSGVLVHHLGAGYFNASGLPKNPESAAEFLEETGRTLAARSRNGVVLFMNGIDHALPDPHTDAVVEVLRRRTEWQVERGLLEEFVRELRAETPSFRGELVGGRVANLLSGVWSMRVDLKLRNRRCEAELEGWAEPWAALLRMGGGPDERPSLRQAWRALLRNQAHDSICGCSQDRVHDQMQARYDTAEELASQTTQRALERISGLGTERRTPWSEPFSLAVFNPSPQERTDLVRLPIDPSVWFETGGETSRELRLHPLLAASGLAPGFTVDGQPARVVDEPGSNRLWLSDHHPPRALEFVARGVPALGWSKVTLAVAPEPFTDEIDEGREIECEGLRVSVADDGTFSVGFGDRTYAGLCGIEDTGDRGDTYDFDPVPGGIALVGTRVSRWRHPGGLQGLVSERTFQVPAGLSADRSSRSTQSVELKLRVEARIQHGVSRVDLGVTVENSARDHRLRLLFPTGSPTASFRAATTFDVAERSTEVPQGEGWLQPPQATFPHQGFVSANGLTVVAPGLPEAEVTSAGVIGITLLRCVGWLARMDLATRPAPAGPQLATVGSQSLGRTEAWLALLPGCDARAARDAELGLRSVLAGAVPLWPPGREMLALEPRSVMLSAFIPSMEGEGQVVRLLNPTSEPVEAAVRCGFPVNTATSVRLDEEPDGGEVMAEQAGFRLRLGPHEFRSVLLR